MDKTQFESCLDHMGRAIAAHTRFCSSQDYESVEMKRWLDGFRDGVKLLAMDIADYFEQNDIQFDTNKFLKDCGVDR